MSETAREMFDKGWRVYAVKETAKGNSVVWIGKITDGILVPAESSLSRLSIDLAFSSVAARVRASAEYEFRPGVNDLIALAMMTAQSSGASPEEIDQTLARAEAVRLFDGGWRFFKVSKKGLGFHDVLIRINENTDKGIIYACHLESAGIKISKPVAQELGKLSRQILAL